MGVTVAVMMAAGVAVDPLPIRTGTTTVSTTELTTNSLWQNDSQDNIDERSERIEEIQRTGREIVAFARDVVFSLAREEVIPAPLEHTGLYEPEAEMHHEDLDELGALLDELEAYLDES